MLLEGLFLPLTTPFHADGRLNLPKLEDNVRRYSKTPAAGLVALSATGQPSLLSDIETREALRTVAEAAAAEKVLIAGAARDSVLGTLTLIDYAAEVGYDVALVPGPSLRLETKALLTFYQAVADRVPLPVLLDSRQGQWGENAIELVSELAQHPNVIGMTDSSGTPASMRDVLRRTISIRHDVIVTNVFAAATKRMLAKNAPAEAIFLSAGSLAGGGTALSASPPATRLKTRSKSVGFQVLSGRTASILSALVEGATGAMVPLAAAAPQACYEVLAAWKDGDPALAEEKQERLRIVAHRIEEEMGVAGIKYGCDLNGYFGGRPRLPGLPLTGVEREETEELMRPIPN